MSDCNICFHKNDGKVMRRPILDGCDSCNGGQEGVVDACVYPPLGQPKLLPIIAPVIFDECGINLCRQITIPERIINKYPTTETMELKVLDIDFNFCKPEGSDVEFLTRRPNCVSVKLARLCVTFLAKFLSPTNKLLGTECFAVEYLPDSCSPHYDEETNPTSVTVELYAPYGLSYKEMCKECNDDCVCKPVINFLGYVDKPDQNNLITQGIVSQALATVVDLDFPSGCLAAGISIYLKTVYFVQYKVQHAGLVVPPKCLPIEDCGNACKDFVEGDLLEQSIQPLEVSVRPKTICPCEYEEVQDPTPAEAEIGTGNDDNCNEYEHSRPRGFFARP